MQAIKTFTSTPECTVNGSLPLDEQSPTHGTMPFCPT